MLWKSVRRGLVVLTLILNAMAHTEPSLKADSCELCSIPAGLDDCTYLCDVYGSSNCYEVGTQLCWIWVCDGYGCSL